jgi:hypothetical protein
MRGHNAIMQLKTDEQKQYLKLNETTAMMVGGENNESDNDNGRAKHAEAAALIVSAVARVGAVVTGSNGLERRRKGEWCGDAEETSDESGMDGRDHSPLI